MDANSETKPIINSLGSPCGVVANALNRDIVIREFKQQSRYYVHFRINSIGKGMDPLIPFTTVLQRCFDVK